MHSRTHRSVIVQQRAHPAKESFPQVRPAPDDVVAMDDREEQEELVSLLILREDRRRGVPARSIRSLGKEAAA